MTVRAVWYLMESSVSTTEPPGAFERLLLPHLDAAYNLARWLAGNEHDAADISQEACLRAWQFRAGYRGGDTRSWLLAIVRNTAYSWLKKNRPQTMVALTDGEMPEIEDPQGHTATIEKADVAALRTGLESLPVEYREALVLRELEGLSYKEISDVSGLPLGTVMSRLSRARRQLQAILQAKGANE
jgi:RNA polymerase sigma-70 factor (ECF subfamily)